MHELFLIHIAQIECRTHVQYAGIHMAKHTVLQAMAV